MSTRINTNTTAMMAAENLSMNSDKVSQNIQRLSSGLRINSAADDPSGLVISESMQAQVTGLNQATSNTNDAINVVKTAEGALNETQSLLMNVRQLVLHAANSGANDPPPPPPTRPPSARPSTASTASPRRRSSTTRAC